MSGSKSVLIDTNIFINHFENDNSKSTQALEYVFEKKYKTYISVLTISELLIKPIQQDREDLKGIYLKLLNQDNFEIIDIDYKISIKAAEIRAKYKIRLPDAIIIASAISVNADLLLTNDKELMKVEELMITDRL